jgi:hypothetical protein
MGDYSGLIEHRMTDGEVAITVSLLAGAAIEYDKAGDGDQTPMLDDVIANAEQHLANFTDNMTRLLTALKEKRDARTASTETN